MRVNGWPKTWTCPPWRREGRWTVFVDGLREVLDYAAASNVLIGFEPEPGMFIDTMRAFEELLAHMEIGGADISVRRQTFLSASKTCRSRQTRMSVLLVPRTATDARRRPLALPGRNADCRCDSPLGAAAGEHAYRGHAGRPSRALDVWRGEIDFPPVLRTLAEVGYTGGVYVELSRHSHEGPTAARRAFEFLTRMMNDE